MARLIVATAILAGACGPLRPRGHGRKGARGVSVRTETKKWVRCDACRANEVPVTDSVPETRYALRVEGWVKRQNYDREGNPAGYLDYCSFHAPEAD